MLRAGDLRRRMAETLNAAYGDGLLSQATLAYRLDLLFGSAIVRPEALVGDLSLRRPRPTPADELRRTLRRVRHRLLAAAPGPPPAVLALDWTGAHEELLVGRHLDCDVVVGHPTVSRHHARLTYRDGRWILRDLRSTNGTRVNGQTVVRCQLRPGDRLALGDELLLVD